MPASSAAEPSASDTPQPSSATPEAEHTELTPAEQTAAREARDSGRRVLVDELTSETTQVWALPEGGFQAEIAAGVERFQRDGVWTPVDLNLQRTASGAIEPVAHPAGLRISGERAAAPGAELASVSAGSSRVAMGWAGSLPEPTLDGPKATYSEVLPGIDLIMEATTSGVEQFFVVKNRAAVSQVANLKVPVTGAGVASQQVSAEGDVAVRDSGGRDLAYVSAPVMWDAHPKLASGQPSRMRQFRPGVSAKAKTATSQRGVELDLGTDTAWMLDSQTVFPVTIDPVLSPAPAVTFDTYVHEGDTTVNNATNDLWVGSVSGKKSRSFIHWNTSALVGKQITASTVSFWDWWSQSCTATSWEIWPTAQATTATVWSNQPVWYDADPNVAGDQPAATSTQTKGFDSTCDDDWINISGVKFFQYAANNSWTVAPMGIRATNETDADSFKQLRSVDNTTTTVYPKATVTYNSYPKVTSRSTTPATSCVTGASRPAIKTTTPTFAAVVSDGEATAMSVVFEWWAVGGTAKIGSATVSSVASGATASTVVPAGQLQEGGNYQWRATVSDGTGSSATSWCEFSSYVTLPPVDGCQGGVGNDFNGDGLVDSVVAAPRATVDGLSAAGAVHIVDGVAGTVTVLREGAGGVPDTAAAGDQFGRSIAVFDANSDGCTDLAVGAPFDEIGTTANAGRVFLIYGAPGGLGTGPATLVVEQGRALEQGRGTVPDAAEAEDWFGFSLAGGRTAAGEPFLVVGVPGEDVGTAIDVGKVHYLRGTVNIAFDESNVGAGALENDDRYGYALAATQYHFAVAQPGEAIGASVFSGSVCTYQHTITNSLPVMMKCVYQGLTGVAGTSDPGDQFGKSIAMVPYRPVGAAAGVANSLLVVGAPGDDVGGVGDAGSVYQFLVSSTDTAQVAAHNQNSAGIAGDNAEGDYFGEQVTVVNTNPAAEASAATVQVAVGAPGKDLGALDAGQVHVFAGGTATVTVDTEIYRRAGSVPNTPRTQELLGAYVGGNPQRLMVASPYGAKAVYAFDWSSLAGGSAVPTSTWTAGAGGFLAGVGLGMVTG
ncbi:hypothetical protein GCM10010112_25950 [Actinoplanes lobatus]|nr:FG-GAP repeat protein [Actinoplanes lobatus]MBB4751636.1 hypothetical protein [Actinoplanes lobatus]GGN65060.1 hypothetical protein GCM10010112_25950 [Actinoplanes lobatus]